MNYLKEDHTTMPLLFKWLYLSANICRLLPALHCKENPSYVFLFWELCGLISPNFHIIVSVSDLYIRSTYFPATGQAEQSWKYIHTVYLSQIYERRNWETEHYNSVLEITVSFLGIHKWEPDIYIGFPPALHLQCISVFLLSIRQV